MYNPKTKTKSKLKTTGAGVAKRVKNWKVTAQRKEPRVRKSEKGAESGVEKRHSPMRTKPAKTDYYLLFPTTPAQADICSFLSQSPDNAAPKSLSLGLIPYRKNPASWASLPLVLHPLWRLIMFPWWAEKLCQMKSKSILICSFQLSACIWGHCASLFH